MNLNPKKYHHITTGAKKNYTCFKWSMNDWSLLSDYYSRELASPAFDITGEPEKQIRLFFQKINSYDSTVAIVMLELIGGNIQFRTLQMTVSIVDEFMNKLLTKSQRFEQSTFNPATCNELKLGNGRKSFAQTSLDKFVRKDTLTLFFELTIVKGVKETGIDTFTMNRNVALSHRTLANFTARQNFRALRSVQEFCDIVFDVRGTQLFAHKVILGASSSFFRTNFTGEFKEFMDIDKFEPHIFDSFLNFLYTGQVEDMDTLAYDLLYVADEYNVMELKEMCENYMSAHVDVSNAFKYLVAGHTLHCPNLKARALHFLQLNVDIAANLVDHNMLNRYPDLMTQIFGSTSNRR